MNGRMAMERLWDEMLAEVEFAGLKDSLNLLEG